MYKHFPWMEERVIEGFILEMRNLKLNGQTLYFPQKQTYGVCIFQICISLVEDEKWNIENWEY